ncbi:MAG: hypothetical protein IIB26_09330 [Chloroflexi bacterium]|nr:hypothetical protein [Chloroflexota bacterium]
MVWFDDRAEFESEAKNRQLRRNFVEDLESSNLPPNRIMAMADPLNSDSRTQPYPDGLPTIGLTIQSNIRGGNPVQPDPRGANGLAAASRGWQRAVSYIVFDNTFVDSCDVILDAPNVFAVGASTIDALGRQQGVQIRVFDRDNNLLGMMAFEADIQGTHFAGVIADVAVGRINVFSVGSGVEGLDNIEGWFDQQRRECDFEFETCRNIRKIKAKCKPKDDLRGKFRMLARRKKSSLPGPIVSRSILVAINEDEFCLNFLENRKKTKLVLKNRSGVQVTRLLQPPGCNKDPDPVDCQP